MSHRADGLYTQKVRKYQRAQSRNREKWVRQKRSGSAFRDNAAASSAASSGHSLNPIARGPQGRTEPPQSPPGLPSASQPKQLLRWSLDKALQPRRPIPSLSLLLGSLLPQTQAAVRVCWPCSHAAPALAGVSRAPSRGGLAVGWVVPGGAKPALLQRSPTQLSLPAQEDPPPPNGSSSTWTLRGIVPGLCSISIILGIAQW